MAKIVEDIPRLELPQLRDLPNWEELKKEGEIHLVLKHDGEQIEQRLELTTDATPYGRRWWFACPACHARCLHLYLHEGDLRCRRCCGGGLIYLQQAMPSRFREEIGVHVLRLWRRSSPTIKPQRMSG